MVETTFAGSSTDPAFADGNTSLQVLLQIYQPLVTTDDKDPSKVDPLVAQSWAPSPDGTSVTFKLRTDIHFSDGTPLTADDVVFSLTRLKNALGNFNVLVSGYTVTASDKYTVVVSSAKPDVSIPLYLASPATGILNSKVVRANGGTDAPDAAKTDQAQAFLNQHSAGSGPYELVSRDPASLVALKVDPNYWGSKPVYAKVEFRNVASSTQALDVQRNAGTTVLDLSSYEAANLDKSAVNIRTVQSLEVFMIELNLDQAVSPNSANQDFRSAVRYGVDYQKLVAIAGPGAVQAQGFLATGLPGALPANQAVTRDVSKAQALLASSGLKNPSINLEYTSNVTASGVPLADAAQAIQASLKDVGITVNLVPEVDTVFSPRWVSGKCQMLIRPFGGNTFAPGISLLFTPFSFPAKFSGWKLGSDPTLEDLVNQAYTATTPQQYADVLMKIEVRRNDDAVFIPLFNATLVEASSKDVGNMNMNAGNQFKVWEMT